MMAATRPGPGSRQEAAEAAEAATTPVTTATAPVMTATGTRTEEGAIDPTQADMVTVEAGTRPTATLTATRWRRSSPRLSRSWWSRWWGPRSAISSATGGEIVLGPTNRRTCERPGAQRPL